MKRSGDLIVDLNEVTSADLSHVGGKALALALLDRSGARVPQGVCLTTTAYNRYLDLTGMRERLPFLLERKAFAEMRWEELWDLALKVRHLFVTTPLPDVLAEELAPYLSNCFADIPVTVRSSAPAEDSATASFAGLHDSFVNVYGLAAILDKVRLVWASLWSDRALLYRQELGLDPATSSMAVLVQELIVGRCSGVVFSRCPGRPHLAALEAVWGLNQGLVDGDVEPDRILFDASGAVVERYAPQRERASRPVIGGVTLQPLSADERNASPLSDADAKRIFALQRHAEEHFGAPQDMEWTLRGADLFLLQSRPITASGTAAEGDERGWYLSLHKSLATLHQLRRTIEDDLLPAMELDAQRLASADLTSMDDEALAAEIQERRRLLDAWEARYRDVCIPMAHGIRLFGQWYNDRLRPEDPFAFLELLTGDQDLLAMQRNEALQTLAERLSQDPGLAEQLREGCDLAPDNPFSLALRQFTTRFGGLSWVMGTKDNETRAVTLLLLEMAKSSAGRHSSDRQVREADYLAAFAPEEHSLARDLLEIGRAAYRLRDNDNLFIGKLSEQLRTAYDEAEGRLAKREIPALEHLIKPERMRVARRITANPSSMKQETAFPGSRQQARQLVGQPAGPGLARGRAHVIRSPEDLRTLKSGDILVCDAVDPNMTFVVPLAGGIVERRGGMLIHGAIIAREYGIACVTGVPHAIDEIRTGDQVTVDGYLGLVTIDASGGRGLPE
ncbi:PEP/pyruvate-binding domain-containing protein [Geoalkalibacter halelectricus]|uniref:PEP-utilizing enzyme n=1 Tax=Geoalkalibacter halelectricus TaxID=2847045 RepID=A0ABY5ZJA0_9BACT|nr:PEP/pyruvate-binding domain-containing protein [Geoalkalibacter halelectricus]MDO3379783.1 PEP-utilizing enzyme [Geoalkalibacter halelectricus]UWZ79217.1 PEP-utilizing enzyme [Geoalkalibacter halelectricus]